MIQTSYFARAASLPNAVAISQGIPKWYTGARYKPLAPSWELINLKDPKLYKIRYYEEVLSKLDPKQVAADLEDCILLCHEKDSTFCHRRIVAEWLEAALGIKVPEMDYAVKKMPSLWDYEKKEEHADNKAEISPAEKVPWQDSGLEPDIPPVEKLKVIDRRPGEYPDLGLNLYANCSHDCWYCYNKRTNRNPNLPYDKPSKKASNPLDIERDLQKLMRARDIRPVFMSAVGDLYDMGREDNSYTRIVLEMFRSHNYPFYVLTKGGTKAVKDFDLYSPNDKFGVTLTFDNDADSRRWEPGAALPGDRIEALQEAHNRGIHTWVSIEPVMYTDQSLNLIEMTYEFVDLFCVGKLNHIPAYESVIDWPMFRSEVEALLLRCGKQPGIGYRLDRQLINAK